MKPYAIFLSLTDNYVYLFNALYNSAEFFGVGEYAEFVVIHDDSVPEKYIDFMVEKTESLSTKVRFVKVDPLPEDKGLGKVMTIKYYRYKIMSEIGREYKAICFIDSDIFLASGIKEYFDIAAATDIVIGVNDNVVRNYHHEINMGTCPAIAETKEPVFDHSMFDGKFICNVPTFVDMNKYHDVFYDVFMQRKKLGMDNTWPFNGDLETMNVTFIKRGVKDRLLVLASHLWTGVHYSIYRVSTAVKRWNPPKGTEVVDKQYKRSCLFMSETCEHVRAFHGRDWASEKSERALKDRNIPKLIGQMEGKFEGSLMVQAQNKREGIFDMIQAFFLFLQFECFVSIDDVESICPTGGGRYEYFKTKQEQLSSIIKSFGEN